MNMIRKGAEYVPQSIEPSKNEKLNSFQDKLQDAWKKMYPEYSNKSIVDYKQRQKKVEQIEKIIRDQEILKLLTEFNIDPKLFEKRGKLFKIKVGSHFQETRLPDGYAFTGGAARALLLRALGIKKNAQPRDVDLARIVQQEPEPGMDIKLSKEMMPNDFTDGYQATVINSLNSYFKSRDFTLNKVLATDNEIFLTKQCLSDTIRGIIRLSDSEREIILEDDKQYYKMQGKLLRFYTNAIAQGDHMELLDGDYETLFITPWWIGVNLDRAYEISEVAAETFTTELVKRQVLPSTISTAQEAVEYLRNEILSSRFYFRHAPSAQFIKEQKWSEQYEDEKMYE